MSFNKSIFLFLTFLSQFLWADNPKKIQSQLKDIGLKGNVKTYKLTPYKVVDYFGKIVKGDKQDFWSGDVVIVFNEKGYKTETNRYNKTGQLSQKIIYKYDAKGARTVRDVYNSYGKIQMKFLYVYDTSGNKIAYNSYKPTGELVDTYTYKNDAKGRMIEEIWTKPDKTFGSRYTFNYDARGFMTETTQYTKSSTSLDNRTVYKYNKLGQLSEIEIYNDKNTLTKKNIITYDDKGNESSIKTFGASGEFIDEKQYKYVFDDRGNWIERTEYVNHFPKSIIEREITYY